MSWYIVVARKRRGPLSTAQLSEELQAGKVPLDAWAWTEGMDEWVPAGEIRELRPRPVVQRVVPQPQPEPERAPRATVNAPQPVSRGAAKTAPSKTDETSAQTWQQKLGVLLLRHWRGELSLPVSFWVMVLASTLVVAFIGAIVDALSLADAPEFVAFVTLAFLAFASAIIVWQLVGVWRSAQNYRARGGQKIWAQLAMGVTAIAAARFVVDVILVQAPIALEMLRIVDGDTGSSNHSVLVLRGSEELGIDGPIGFGLASAMAEPGEFDDSLQYVSVPEVPEEST